MRTILPPPGTGLPQILDAIRQALIPAVSQNEATPRIILLSPNGTSWAVTIDDAGVIKAEVVDAQARA